MEATVRDIHRTLVHQCRQGDRKAQYELYRLYSKAMFNVAMRITNNYMEAEDVLQEAFVKAFRSLHQFEGKSTFGAWLKRIVVNLSINAIRRKKMDTVDIEDYGRDFVEEAPKSSDTDWNMSQIRNAIRELPDGYRMVLTLYLIEGYDHREISNILQISESASKSQYSRAKKKLRELLTQERDERST